jgi:hypothetical protein
MDSMEHSFAWSYADKLPSETAMFVSLVYIHVLYACRQSERKSLATKQVATSGSCLPRNQVVSAWGLEGLKHILPHQGEILLHRHFNMSPTTFRIVSEHITSFAQHTGKAGISSASCYKSTLTTAQAQEIVHYK